MTEKIKLIKDKKTYTLKVISNSKKQNAIDLEHLNSITGLLSYDPGLKSTAICYSAITFADVKKGELFYRDINIKELINSEKFMDIAYLLVYGRFPLKKNNINLYNSNNVLLSYLPIIKETLSIIPKESHPLDTFRTLLSHIATFDNNADMESVISIIPYLILLIKNKKIYSSNIEQNNFIDSFLCRFLSKKNINNEASILLKLFLIIHMDHEQNASTTALKISHAAGSSPIDSVLVATSVLCGKKHGGANEEALKMLKKIKNKKDIERIIDNAKYHNKPIYGFGHRLYKTADPRAKILKQYCKKYCKKSPILKNALDLEKAVLEDDFFKRKKVFPNLDLYSGILLNSINIKDNFITLFFILSRSIGWLAHWKESTETKNVLIRPRQLYQHHFL